MKKSALILIAVIVVLVGIIAIPRMGKTSGAAVASLPSGAPNTAVAPVEKRDVGKDADIVVKPGKPPVTIKYTVDSVDRTGEIVLNGQKATAVQGRKFVIVHISLTNNDTQGYAIQTRDYLRLTMPRLNGKWLAPDIHSDPVEVQASSTELTRLGFPVNDTDRQFTFRIRNTEGGDSEFTVNF